MRPISKISKKLIEFISERLKPKDTEKRKFGEVFTPLDFIEENMLKDLDNFYKKKYKLGLIIISI